MSRILPDFNKKGSAHKILTTRVIKSKITKTQKMKAVYKNFGSLVKALRILSGVKTPKDLALIIGVSKERMVEIEEGREYIDKDLLRRLAKSLKIKVRTLERFQTDPASIDSVDEKERLRELQGFVGGLSELIIKVLTSSKKK